MLSYCLKCKKTKKKKQKKQNRKYKPKSFQKLVTVKKCCYQNVQYMVVKNQNWSKNKKQMNYWVVDELKHH